LLDFFFFLHFCDQKTNSTMPPPSTRARALALCAAFAVLAAAASAAVVSEGCICSDVRPRVGTGPTHVDRFTPAATCAEIRAAGQCNEKWMLDTVKELEGEGYCKVRDFRGRTRAVRPWWGGRRPESDVRFFWWAEGMDGWDGERKKGGLERRGRQ
jgi:hypothetical protein